MIYKIFPFVSALFCLLIISETNLVNTTNSQKKFEDSVVKSDTVSAIENRYNNLKTNNCHLPNFESFDMAMKGYTVLKEKGLIQKDILTLVDFSMSSNSKRLWVIDLVANKILYNSLVAHGRNTGEEFANNFSNKNSSYQSSLGFYATGETYNGKHGMSLKLDGLERGINDNARVRGVVIHGADYVSESFIRNNKRLGRSQGCPAVPVELSKDIINAIKDKSCLFIYHPSENIQKIASLI